MSFHPLGQVAPPVHLQFDDNRLLPLLFGEHDQHLARLERELGVSMVSRGNQLIISGAEDSVATARQILTGLYQRLKRGVLFEEEGKLTRPARLHGIASTAEGGAIVHVVLREGMKRQVRRMFQSVGIEVLHLERIAIGGLELGSLSRGAWRKLAAKDISLLTSPPRPKRA